jgi:UPF0716 protein FxsA
MFRLGCLFILVPLLELVLLFRIGQWVGVAPTLLLVGVTGIVGAVLARREGVRALMAVQMEMARGRLPTRPLLDGAAVLVGGAFLVTPGVLTDVIGLLLLLPPTRWLLYRWIQVGLARAVARGTVRMHVWGAGMSDASRSAPNRDREVKGPRSGHSGSRGRTGSDRGSQGDQARDDERPPRPGEIIQE